MDYLFSQNNNRSIIQRNISDTFTMNIQVPTDSDGKTARECPSDNCSPGYFKVKSGTGITENHQTAYCPYCRHSSEPNNFTTKEQLRYAKDFAIREVNSEVNRMIQNALDIGPSGKKKIGTGPFSIEMSFKPSTLPHVRRPLDEELKRDVICPHCGLDHSVYGLASWCPDCGQDILLTHIESEYNVIRIMVQDIKRRKELLGPRIAAKDIENCLEDVVSIFEAVIKIFTQRFLTNSGLSNPEIYEFFRTKIGNKFQSISRTEQFFTSEFQINIYDPTDSSKIKWLSDLFEKRHPITHNLGIIDRKYLEKVRTADREGREIRVNIDDIEKGITQSFDVVKSVHNKLIYDSATPMQNDL